MSISKLPLVQTDNWQLIATSSPTSGSVISFTSISTAWRKLWLVTTARIDLPASAMLVPTVNSLTGTQDYNYFRYIATGHSFADESGIYPQSLGTAGNLSLIFQNPGNSQPFVTFDGITAHNSNAGNRVTGWIPPATTNITQIDVTVVTSDYSINTGTFKLYGTY